MPTEDHPGFTGGRGTRLVAEAAVTRRSLVLGGAVILAVAGSWLATTMPVDVLPDLTAPTVTVITEATGLAAEEVERLVTFPIETAVNGSAGVRRVRSVSTAGISIVWVEFSWGTETFRARRVVEEKLRTVEGALPPNISAPHLAPIASVMGEILFIGVRGAGEGADRLAPEEVRAIADQTVRPRLMSVAGVAQVVVIGAGAREFHVLLDPIRLTARGVGPGEVRRALEATSISSAAGFMNEGGQEYAVRGLTTAADTGDIGDTVVAMRGDEPVLVRHVAEVVIGAAPVRGSASMDAEPTIVLAILKQPGTNTLEVTARIDAAIAEMRDTMPAVTFVDTGFRQATFIERAVSHVVAALRDGVILVLLVLLLFMGDLRAATTAAVAIPLSLITAVVAMAAAGMTLNTMTLGGLTVAIGVIVDDAIIVTENVFRRGREAGPQRDLVKLVVDATAEVGPSIVYATLITLVAFLPLFFLSGVEGRLVEPLARAFIVAVGASLAVAVTVTPVVALTMLRSIRRERSEGRVVRAIKAAYRPTLAGALAHRGLVVASAVALVIAAGVAIATFGRSFLPPFNEGSFTVALVAVPGTSLAESDRIGRHAEELLLALPEVASTTRRTGRAELDEHAQAVFASEIDVVLVDDPARGKEELEEAIREDLSALSGVAVSVGQPISHRIDHLLSGTRAAIAVKVSGEDLLTLRGLAAGVRDAMSGVEGIVDLSLGSSVDVPELRVLPDRGSLARHGGSVRDVAESLELALGGREVGAVWEGSFRFPMVLRYDEEMRTSLHALREVPVELPGGGIRPLRLLAKVGRDLGPYEIARESLRRTITVSANVSGRDLGSVVGAVEDAIRTAVPFPPRYRFAIGGQFESQQRATRIILVLGLVSLLLVLGLLVAALGRLSLALLVLVNLPLGLVGGAAAVWMAGGVLDIAAMLGFLALFGIAVRNGILLVSHIEVLRHGGLELEQAIRQGSEERLAPILMTAVTTALALAPVVYRAGEPGNEIQAPLALVVLGGLISSTLLNLIVVPVLMHRLGDRGRRSAEATAA